MAGKKSANGNGQRARLKVNQFPPANKSRAHGPPCPAQFLLSIGVDRYQTILIGGAKNGKKIAGRDSANLAIKDSFRRFFGVCHQARHPTPRLASSPPPGAKPWSCQASRFLNNEKFALFCEIDRIELSELPSLFRDTVTAGTAPERPERPPNSSSKPLPSEPNTPHPHSGNEGLYRARGPLAWLTGWGAKQSSPRPLHSIDHQPVRYELNRPIPLLHRGMLGCHLPLVP